MSSDLFFDENENLKLSSVSLGVQILGKLEKKKQATVYEVFDYIRTKNTDVNYSNIMNSLTFLYLTGLVTFNKPYIELVNDNN